MISYGFFNIPSAQCLARRCRVNLRSDNKLIEGPRLCLSPQSESLAARQSRFTFKLSTGIRATGSHNEMASLYIAFTWMI
jgi:hypothetical protein